MKPAARSLVVIVALALLPAAAAAQPGPAAPAATGTAASILRDAARALEAGEHQRAADLARGVLAATDLPAVDRAEAWRIHGLASFFLERFDEAEAAFLSYLQLEFDGRLDPALVPPEAIVFFEDVRARHAAELRAYRPKPQSKRYRALNLLPPAGQLQNGHRTKGWVIAGAGAALLATHAGTYLILRQWCDRDTGVCSSGGESRTETARLLRTVNLASGALLLGTVAYGIFDGFTHYDDTEVPRSRTVSVQLCPGLDCGYISLYKQF